MSLSLTPLVQTFIVRRIKILNSFHLSVNWSRDSVRQCEKCFHDTVVINLHMELKPFSHVSEVFFQVELFLWPYLGFSSHF